MAVAAHRVVGIVEWPEKTEALSELPANLADEILQLDNAYPARILSWRLPVAEAPTPAVLSADIVQLRSDLQRLFDDVTRLSPR